MMHDTLSCLESKVYIIYKREILLLICANTEKQERAVSGCGFTAFYFLVCSLPFIASLYLQSGESVFYTDQNAKVI